MYQYLSERIQRIKSKRFDSYDDFFNRPVGEYQNLVEVKASTSHADVLTFPPFGRNLDFSFRQSLSKIFLTKLAEPQSELH